MPAYEMEHVLAVAVLLLTAGHLVYRAFRLRQSDQSAGLIFCVVILLLLLIVLPIAWMYSDVWRQIAKDNGFYQNRASTQRFATSMVFCGIPVLGLLGGISLGVRRLSVVGVMVFSLVLLSIVALRVVSYHPVDHILGLSLIANITLFKAVVGSAIFGLNACLLGCVEDDALI